MRTLITQSTFRRDYKRMKRRHKNVSSLKACIELLCAGKSLPVKMKPHKLIGKYAGYSECHIEPDWLLIYSFNEENLVLVRTGSHADLFE
ncbi:MAG: type II toxin-antitoxin system YafQ family toxin [Candidatus Paceibacterota bacterium]